ncbi:MAG: Fur family transcriptional regulator [Actinomycetota bacterium]
MTSRSSNSIHEIAVQRLHKINQRYSSRRRRLVDALVQSAHPMTAPDIVALDADLPQSSVYRNLAVLEAAGVVVKVLTNGDRAAFELAEELKGHHHHLVCVGCGLVLDVEIPADVEKFLTKGMSSVAENSGFELEGHRLDLLGRCSTCTSTLR